MLFSTELFSTAQVVQLRDPGTGRFAHSHGYQNKRQRSLLITSPEPGEGKTTVASNLAIALAQLGRSVLLIDADLRRPSLHKVFHLANAVGLSNYLMEELEIRRVQSSDVPGLDVLVCGPIPPNPAELVSSKRMQALLQKAEANYDFVVLDAPPLLSVEDPRILAALVDGVIMVVKSGATPRELVRRAGVQACQANAKLIGIVLNQIDPLNSDYYYYKQYRSTYGKNAMTAEENREESSVRIWD